MVQTSPAQLNPKPQLIPALAAFATSAVLSNWLTTGDHLLRSLAHRHLWAVGGMDLLLLVGAAAAAIAAIRLRGRC